MAAFLELKGFTVGIHHWLTFPQLIHLYSVGQMASGPAMMMIVSIGEWLAGPLGVIWGGNCSHRRGRAIDTPQVLGESGRAGAVPGHSSVRFPLRRNNARVRG